jgi:hypothetical protein
MAGAWKWPFPSSVEVKNACSYTSTPQYSFMAWCSVKAQGQLYFYPYIYLMSVYTIFTLLLPQLLYLYWQMFAFNFKTILTKWAEYLNPRTYYIRLLYGTVHLHFNNINVHNNGEMYKGKFSLCVNLYHAMTSALDEGEWSATRSGRFTPGKEPSVLFH